jgi:uncharacterized membrane protein
METAKRARRDLHVLTDEDVKRKAVRSVLLHARKKVPSNYEIIAQFNAWASETEAILERPDFDRAALFEARHRLNDLIERTYDPETRFKLRDSWVSFGKALDKKLKPK